MSRWAWLAAIAAVIVVASFGAGYWVGTSNSKGYTIYVGDCYAATNEASCTVGDLTFGVSEVVAWTDVNNVGKGGPNDPAEWPTCLPPFQTTKGVRFAGALLPIGDGATVATIVWVDCRAR
jgi:hypothetical protein